MATLISAHNNPNHTNQDKTIYSKIQQLQPDYYYIPSPGTYDKVDLVAVDDTEVKAIFEVKSRSADKCKYVRRDESLLLDKKKVEALTKLSKENNCKAIAAQYLEDTKELTLFEVANKGQASDKIQYRTQKANANTRWGGGKVDKELAFYNLEDCHRSS